MINNRLVAYNREQSDCPNILYKLTDAEEMRFCFAEEPGHISGGLKALPKPIQNEAIINMMRRNQ